MVALLASFLAAAVVAATNAPVDPLALPPAAPRTALPVDSASGFSVSVGVPVDDLEARYQALLALDDAAQEEMDVWIREADDKRGAADAVALQKRVDARVAEVDRAYREFLERHPGHARARVAYGSFLEDTGQEPLARAQWEKALELEPRNPAIHNNLAGLYGHRGPITNAFHHFEKAIDLAPRESTYYRNFATVVFLFRRDAMEYYSITNEQQVFDKALGLYRKALSLDPDNFIVAADLAQTYYLIKPSRHEEALAAWQRAYGLAGDDLEREGVRLHLARVQVQAGLFDAARTNLALITNTNYAVVRERVLKTLQGRENPTPEMVPDAPRF